MAVKTAAQRKSRPSRHGGLSARIVAWAIFAIVPVVFYMFRFHGTNNLDILLRTRSVSTTLLWNGIATILIRNLPDQAEALLTALSCISCGIVASLLFASMRCLMLMFFRGTYHTARPRKVAAWIAGLVAAVAFLFHQPNWIAVGWVRPEMFETAFATIVASLFVFAIAKGRFRYFAAFAFLYGLLIFENADMLRLAPLFLIFTLFLLARTNKAHLHYILSLGALFVFGAAIYLFLVDMEVGHPVNQVNGMAPTLASSFDKFVNSTADFLGIRRGQIFFHHTMSDTSNFWITIVTHFKETFIVWPHQQTSLLLLLVTIAPWITAMALGSWTFGRTPRRSELLLHLLLAASVAVGLSQNSLSPWGMMGPMIKTGSSLPLPCMAYAMMASTIGYLAGWGAIRADGSLFSRAPVAEAPTEDDDDEEEFFQMLHTRTVFYFARVLTWAIIVFAIYMSVQNFDWDVRRGVIPDRQADSLSTQMFKARE